MGNGPALLRGKIEVVCIEMPLDDFMHGCCQVIGRKGINVDLNDQIVGLHASQHVGHPINPEPIYKVVCAVDTLQLHQLNTHVNAGWL